MFGGASPVKRLKRDFDEFLYQEEQQHGGLLASSSRKLPPASQKRHQGSTYSTRRGDAPAVKLQFGNGTHGSSSILASKDTRIRELEAEVMQLKSRKTSQEDDNAHLKTELARERTARQKDESLRQLETQQDAARIADLERQRRFLADNEERLQAQLKETQKALDETRSDLNNRITNLEREKIELMYKTEKNMDNSFPSDRGPEMESYRLLERELEESNRRTKDLLARVEQLSLDKDEADLRVEQIERKYDELVRTTENQVLDNTTGNSHSAAAERKMRALERDNEYYKRTLENNKLLEVKAKQLEEKLERANQRNLDYQRNQDNQENLEQFRLEWEQVKQESSLADDVSIITPIQLARFCGELQQQILILKDDISEKNASLKGAETTIADLNNKISENGTKIHDLEKSLEDKIIALKKAERTKEFATKNHESVLDILSSYQDEFSRSKGQFEPPRLEEIQKIKDDLSAALAKEAELKAEIAKRDVQLEQMARMASAQRDDGENFKILHLVDNPVQRALDKASSKKERIASATVENAKVLEELDSLREQCATAERKRERLIQVYNDMVQEYKEICYRVTGYTIDAQGGGMGVKGGKTQYRVQSMYAEAQDDYFLFEKHGDDVNIMGTKFVESLDRDMLGRSLVDIVKSINQCCSLDYIKKFHSIPGLLGQVTIDLLAKTTRMV
eukprot:m.104388 g.104388  ORF g.104388 m.104388 type:complete len:683 (+) comp13840_c0_seq17:148-2196(+)